MAMAKEPVINGILSSFIKMTRMQDITNTENMLDAFISAQNPIRIDMKIMCKKIEMFLIPFEILNRKKMEDAQKNVWGTSVSNVPLKEATGGNNP